MNLRGTKLETIKSKMHQLMIQLHINEFDLICLLYHVVCCFFFFRFSFLSRSYGQRWIPHASTAVTYAEGSTARPWHVGDIGPSIADYRSDQRNLQASQTYRLLGARFQCHLFEIKVLTVKQNTHAHVYTHTQKERKTQSKFC